MVKKYDVFGIGNALVDIVTEVSDAFLTNNSVEKGLMTLVDDDRQKELADAINLSESNLACGGSAANTIIAISQFGGKTYYSCKVANDEMGVFYMDDLKQNGVETNLTKDSLSEGTTGKCLVMTTPDTNRTMNTYLGITATFSKDQVNTEALKQAEYLYIEGYLVTSDNGLAAMKYAKEQALENEVKVALTFSDPSMVKYFKSQMAEVVGSGVDLLFCNEEEAMLFTDTNTVNEAKEELKKVTKQFAITLGSKGALLYDGNEFINIDPNPTEAVDSNGAGDMFAGAFLYGITNGKSFREAGKLASLASSKVVSKFGPRLDLDGAKNVLTELA